MSASPSEREHLIREDAKQLCEKYDEDQIVIFFVDRKTKEMGNAFYGRNEDLLERTRKMVEVLYKSMKSYLTGNEQR